jgi:hypothetical protein
MTNRKRLIRIGRHIFSELATQTIAGNRVAENNRKNRLAKQRRE